MIHLALWVASALFLAVVGFVALMIVLGLIGAVLASMWEALNRNWLSKGADKLEAFVAQTDPDPPEPTWPPGWWRDGGAGRYMILLLWVLLLGSPIWVGLIQMATR